TCALPILRKLRRRASLPVNRDAVRREQPLDSLHDAFGVGSTTEEAGERDGLAEARDLSVRAPIAGPQLTAIEVDVEAGPMNRIGSYVVCSGHFGWARCTRLRGAISGSEARDPGVSVLEQDRRRSGDDD